jgi:hypothetical protein
VSDTSIEEFVSRLSGDGSKMTRLPTITPFDLWDEYAASRKPTGEVKEEAVSLYAEISEASAGAQEVSKEELLLVLQFLNKEVKSFVHDTGIHDMAYGGLDVIDGFALPSLDLASLLKMRPSREEFVSHREVSLKLSSVYRCLSEEQRKRDSGIPLLSYLKIVHSGLNNWRNAVTSFLMDDIRFKKIGVTERKRAADQVVCQLDSYLDMFASMKAYVQDTLKSLESRIDLLLRVDSALRLIVNAQGQSISANRVESFRVTPDMEGEGDPSEENSFCGYAPVQESSLEECADRLEKEVYEGMEDAATGVGGGFEEFEHH